MNLMDSWVCLFFTTRAVSGESDWSCTVASHGYTLCRTAAQQAYRGWQDWYQHLRCCGLVMEQQTGDTCHEAVSVEMAPSPKYLEVTHHLRSRVKWQYRGTAQAEPQWTVKHFQPSTELYITSVFFFFFWCDTNKTRAENTPPTSPQYNSWCNYCTEYLQPPPHPPKVQHGVFYVHFRANSRQNLSKHCNKRGDGAVYVLGSYNLLLKHSFHSSNSNVNALLIACLSVCSLKAN